VIDINPAKQGKFIPATGLLVSAPEKTLAMMERNDIIFVMNSNYFVEIREHAGQHFQYYKVDNDEL